MNNLRGIIEEAVVREGVISFARFMELALYCPNFGYYERTDRPPGRRGDFFTSVSTGSLFGELLAGQFAAWLATVRGKEMQIVEAGAHDGNLANDILSWLRGNQPDVFESLEYWILEPSVRRRQQQEKTLAGHAGRVRWFDGWESLPPSGVNGVIFSNELLDAMPAHRVGWDAKAGEWFECGVALVGGELVWQRVQSPSAFAEATADKKSKVQSPKCPAELLAVLPDGFTTEVCPAAVEWWGRAARALKRGKLITIDYGLTAEEFFIPGRKDGTLRAYYQHHQSNDLLARVGEQDLTAQVNFSVVREAGEAAGLTTEGLVTQAQFLTGIVGSMSKVTPKFEEWISNRAREFQTLTHPEHLGQKFHVLTQSR